MKINIDKMIEGYKCPAAYMCSVATTNYSSLEREHTCYKCWLRYCKENNIEIIYS